MFRVLVVDDQPHVRAAIVAALKELDCDVVAVDSGRAGMDALEGASFDLAMVDIYMPEMDGVQFIKMLRGCTPNLPVIAMSGATFRSSGRNVLSVLPMAPGLSRVAYLKKPFRPAELMQAIEKATTAAAVAW